MKKNHLSCLKKVASPPQLSPLAIAVGCLFASASIYAVPINAPVVVGPGQTVVWDDSYTVDIDYQNGLTVDGGQLTMNGVNSNITNTPNAGFGMGAKNGGTLNLNGGRYDHQTGDSVSAGLSVASGGKISVVGTTLSTKGRGYLLMSHGQGSQISIENADMSTTSGDVLHASYGSEVHIKDSTIKVGSDAPLRLPTYTFAVGSGSKLVGEGLTITSNLEGPSGTTLILSSGSEGGKASEVILSNSSVSSTKGQRLLDATSGALIEGTNLVLNYDNQNDSNNIVAMSTDFGAVMNLTDTQLNVSGAAAAVGLFVTDGGIFKGERFSLNASGKTQGIQLQDADSNVALKDSVIATEDGPAIRFVYGEATAPNQVSLVNTDVRSANGWAVDNLNGHASLNLSGANSTVSGGLGAVSVIATGSDSSIAIGVDNGARLLGDVAAQNNTGMTATVNLDVDNKGLWRGDSVATTDGSVVNIGLDHQARWDGSTQAGSAGSTNVSIGNAATWAMNADASVASLAMASKGQVVLGSGDVTAANQRVLSVGDLSGEGVFTMRTDIVGDGKHSQGDLIKVSGSSAGSHVLNVLNNGAATATGKEVVTVVETADGKADFALQNKVELGGYEYDLKKGGNDWALHGNEKKPTVTKPASAAANFLNIGYLMNYVDTQTLLQRMGDVREGRNGAGNTWERVFGGRLNSFDTGQLQNFDMDYSGFQIGTDRQINVASGSFYAGAMVGYTLGRPHFENGTGKAKDYNLGLYGTYLHDSGWYVDGLVKYTRMNYAFDVKDSAGKKIDGEANSNGYGASVEVGKRFDFANHVYVTPQAQLSYFHQGSSDQTLSNDLDVKLDSYNSTLARVGAVIGYELQQSSHPFSVYAKLGYVREFSGDTNFYLNGNKEGHDFSGGWADLGVGLTAQVNKVHNLYGELSHQNGSRFNKNQLNLGYRYQF